VLAGGDKVRKSSLGGVKTAAEIINFAGCQHRSGRVIESIRSSGFGLWLKRSWTRCSSFEDMLKLDNAGFQAVLKEISSETLVVALKGGSAELKEKVLSNMSSRAAETLKEDLESRGPMRLSEVEAQQKEILKVVRRLADEGTIVLGGGGGDDALI
jgi:flagellar motor switch protein FliG